MRPQTLIRICYLYGVFEEAGEELMNIIFVALLLA